MGAVVDGCPAGVALAAEEIQAALDRRRPGQSTLVTARAEADRAEVLSGVFEGKTLGTPIAVLVRNHDARSGDYDRLKGVDRPGHADRVWRERYGHRDHRGGGRTSGRETLCRVIGGSIAEAYLAREVPGARTVAWVSSVADLHAAEPAAPPTRAEVDAHPTRCPDKVAAAAMEARILAAKQAGDSLGGSIDVIALGLPIGLGEPVFGKLKALLAGALGSIGAVTGVTWGGADVLGSLAKSGVEFHGGDEAAYGGILGGLSTGQPVRLRVYFKPPATLAEHAQGGRHDPCILPRAVPVVEAMVALTVADLHRAFLSSPHRA
jgi:chorismate synthase